MLHFPEVICGTITSIPFLFLKKKKKTLFSYFVSKSIHTCDSVGGYVHRSAGYSGQKRVSDPWSCSYRGLWYGCWCSEGIADTLNHGAISQAPPFILCMRKLKRSLSPWGCEGHVNDFGQNGQHWSKSYLGQNICRLVGVISYLYLKTNRIIWKAVLYFCLAQRVRE